MRKRKSTNKQIAIIVNIVLILLTLAFIWSRSLKSIPDSRAESEAVLEVVRPLLEAMVGEGNVTDHLVRKLAHFSEFCLLGIEMSALAWQSRRYSKKAVILALVAGFLCGAVDETIQAFTARGNQFSDVLLDFAGFVTGAVLIFAFFCVTQRYSNQNVSG